MNPQQVALESVGMLNVKQQKTLYAININISYDIRIWSKPLQSS